MFRGTPDSTDAVPATEWVGAAGPGDLAAPMAARTKEGSAKNLREGQVSPLRQLSQTKSEVRQTFGPLLLLEIGRVV